VNYIHQLILQLILLEIKAWPTSAGTLQGYTSRVHFKGTRIEWVQYRNGMQVH